MESLLMAVAFWCNVTAEIRPATYDVNKCTKELVQCVESVKENDSKQFFKCYETQESK
jgi:hypothetical protein